jgi:hypothetical protein
MSDDNDYPHALEFDTFEDCFTEPPKTWLIEGVIALDEDSTWFGPPGSLKSALKTDIAVHVASGRDWRGHKFARNSTDDDEDLKISENRGVVYFAIERAGLTRRRLAAYAARDGLPGDLPIAVVGKTINLLDPACVSIVADTINRFEVASHCGVGLVIFDTNSKAIAAGKENDAETQNLAALHLKQIREAAAGHFHIATIGHTGKNEGAGERGSNAKLGHVDMAVQISGDKVRTATIVKANDQPEGPIASFKMEEVTVRGKWSDGTDRDPYTVAILAAGTPVPEARTAASQSLTGKHAQALDALTRAIAERGQSGAVHVDFWKEELARVGLLNLKAKNPRSAFKKLRDSVAQHLIAEPDGFVRINPLPGNIAAVAVPRPMSPS